MSSKKPHSRQGFTLIELSIVLVIIGFIVGGILYGKDIVRSAIMRAQISQIEQIESAVGAFQQKYNGLPGDLENATSYFTNVTNGNGDGVICAVSFIGAVSCNSDGTNVVMRWANGSIAESSSVFDQLAAAGLVSMTQYDETANASAKPGVGFPKMVFQSPDAQPGGIVVNYYQAHNYIPAGHKIALGASDSGGGGNLPFEGALKPEEAFLLDSKMDDGKPFTGKVVIQGSFYPYRVPGEVGDPNNAFDSVGFHCTPAHDTDTNEYNIDPNHPYSSHNLCLPIVNASF